MKEKKIIKFETGLKELEEIVEKLENQEIELENSIKLYEKGMELVDFLNKKLEEVRKRIKIIEKKGNNFITKDFEKKNDELEIEEDA